MKVLVVSQLFPPDMGGGSTRAANAVKGLISQGHDVVVVTAFPHYPEGKIPEQYRGKFRSIEISKGVVIARTWVPPVASRGLLRRLLLFLSFCASSLLAARLARKADVVWAANPNVFSVFPSIVFGKLAGAPVVANVDDVWPDELIDLGMITTRSARRLAEALCRIAYTFPAALTPISHAYVDALVSRYDGALHRDRLHVIPAGVDLEVYGLAETASRRENGGFRVTYVGSFSPAYDFDQVLEAARVLSSRVNVEWHLQGAGELAPILEKKARQAGLQNVSVVNRVVAREEVARILSEADVLLLPLGGERSVEMGISSKLYEYLASGKPIVCCSNGESARFVARTKSGIVVRPGDSEDLARTIEFLSQNPEVAASLARSGRDWALASGSTDAIGRLLAGAFRTAIGRHDRRTGSPR